MAKSDTYDSFRITSGSDSPVGGSGTGGAITFVAGNTGEVVLRFCPNGDFIYRGDRVVTDIELYRAFLEFLKSSKMEATKP